MVKIKAIPQQEFGRVEKSSLNESQKLRFIADMCRYNALNAVKKAGSGHLGTSFSVMDILVYLYFSKMNIRGLGLEHPDRDIYLPSKGHDVPAQYAVLSALGFIPPEKLFKLRKLGGLDGHPDVRVQGIEMNSGSLGMGVSKAKGFAWAKARGGRGGRVYVLTGDGELQEGQIYEALQTAVHQRLNNIQVIIDHNMVQSDKPVDKIIDLGDLKKKLESFGFYVDECDGHDFVQIKAALERCDAVSNKPKALIANTVKGRGVSFMEHPQALKEGCGTYRWHAGAPDDKSFVQASEEIESRLNSMFASAKLSPLRIELVEDFTKKPSGVTSERIVEAYGKALLDAGKRRKDLVVLDADLACDCQVRQFELEFPDRFIENGIAEQDMVSMAGGLALSGFLPVVNSFSTFLAARANEQIYTNATEKTKIIYVCHLAGLIPAGPGRSHQGVRDISLFRALPNMLIFEPCNSAETKMVLDYCVDVARESCMIRLIISPSPRLIELPSDYVFSFGRGVVLRDGTDAVIFSYGPVMLHEALTASELLEREDVFLKVVNMPWLNRIDLDWFTGVVDGCSHISSLDNHMISGGFGDFLLDSANKAGLLRDKCFVKLGLDDYPECGTPQEVLRYHGLDGASLASKIKEILSSQC